MKKQDVYMLSKYGDVFNGIIRYGVEIHPNPGVREDDYDEVMNAVDWICSEEKSLKGVDLCRAYLLLEMGRYMSSGNPRPSTGKEYLSDILYEDPDDYTDETISVIESVLSDDPIEDFPDSEISRLKEQIADYVNQNYLRVRVGGKYDTQRVRTSFSGPEDVIYFRISSKGYDWRNTIIDFLYEYFGNDIYKTTTRVWIGHDPETNPPEVVLFEGTPSELEEYMDSKKFESYRRMVSEVRDNINPARRLQKCKKIYNTIYTINNKFN